MRNYNRFKRRIVEVGEVRAFDLGRMIAPLSIDRQNRPALSSLFDSKRCIGWKGRDGDNSAGSFNKVTS